MKPWLGGVVVASMFHVTPTVVLVKQPDAVNTLLPGAGTFVARDVHLSRPDQRRLQQGLTGSPRTAC